MPFPLLTVLIVLPLAGAFLLAVLPRDDEGIRWGALAVALLEAVLAVALLVRYDGSAAGMQFEESASWVALLRIRYVVGVDGLSVFMIALVAGLTPLAMLASWSSVKVMQKEFYVALLLLQASMIGVFAALDLFVFYVFWEMMLLPMALLIGVWGGERRIYASVKFVLYTLVGSLAMLVAILYCYNVAGTFDLRALPGRLAQAAAAGVLEPRAQLLCFGAFALAFAIKVPVVPLHTWLPDAHVEAPTAGSVILAGVLLKMGAYGFLRIAIPFFPQALTADLGGGMTFGGLFRALAVGGIVYGALMAMAQTDMKKLIAYSSVSHLGFVVLGIFSLTVKGVEGAVFQMVNHGLSTGALFLLVGVLYERTHTRGLFDYGGIASVVPGYAFVLVVAALASMGLPGLNGFPGEFLVLLGAAEDRWWTAAAAVLGIVLGAVYMLWMLRRVLFGKMTNARNAALRDLRPREWTMLAPLVASFLILGLCPRLVVDRLDVTVRAWVASVRPGLPPVRSARAPGSQEPSATAIVESQGPRPSGDRAGKPD